MMTVAAQIVPGEHSMPELADASRSRQPALPEPLEHVVRENSFDVPLDEPDDCHDLLLLRPISTACAALLLPPESRSVLGRRALLNHPTKEKGAGVNASPSLITLDSVAQALPM
jgi:hypothetical protein